MNMKKIAAYVFVVAVKTAVVVGVAIGASACNINLDAGDAGRPNVQMEDVSRYPAACVKTGPEICDGRDNDCDGDVQPPTPDCVRMGGTRSVCSAGAWICSGQGITPSDAGMPVLDAGSPPQDVYQPPPDSNGWSAPDNYCIGHCPAPCAADHVEGAGTIGATCYCRRGAEVFTADQAGTFCVAPADAGTPADSGSSPQDSGTRTDTGSTDAGPPDTGPSCTPHEEVFNGMDDNCNGLTDEGTTRPMDADCACRNCPNQGKYADLVVFTGRDLSGGEQLTCLCRTRTASDPAVYPGLCMSADAGTDSGTADAGTPDSGTPDTGIADSGMDAGTTIGSTYVYDVLLQSDLLSGLWAISLRDSDYNIVSCIGDGEAPVGEMRMKSIGGNWYRCTSNVRYQYFVTAFSRNPAIAGTGAACTSATDNGRCSTAPMANLVCAPTAAGQFHVQQVMAAPDGRHFDIFGGAKPQPPMLLNGPGNTSGQCRQADNLAPTH